MKYELINKNIKNKSIKDTVFGNRNLNEQQVYRLLNADKTEFKNPMDIFNMNRAVEMFKKIYHKDLVIAILPDTDVDGYTSSGLLYMFLKDDLNHPVENIKTFYHTTPKTHGLSNDVFDDMLNSDVDLFLIADSGSNDKKQLKQLSKKGKYVILTDHHLCDNYEEIENVIIVNNQLGDLSNNNLAGVGVTAMLIRALGYDIDKYMDIIAIGQIADSMCQLDYQNRAFVNIGLNNIQNELVSAYFNKNKIYKPTITDVSFNIANYMNAIIRVGKQEEKIMLFEALVNKQEEFDYTNKKGETYKETLQERVGRLSLNAKTRQNNSVKALVEKCNIYVIKNHLEKDKVIIVENDGSSDNSITGLLAQKLTDHWKRPCLVLGEKDGYLAGSARGYEGVYSLKDILEETNLCEWCRGHNNAHGLMMKKGNLEKLRKELNEKLKEFEIYDGKKYQVDYVLNANELTEEDVLEIGRLKDIWCTDCKEPIFAIKNLKIDSIKIEKRGLLLKFNWKGFSFMKNYCSKDFHEQLILKKQKRFGKSIPLNLTLIVRFKTIKGKPVLEIVDANSVKDTKVIF